MKVISQEERKEELEIGANLPNMYLRNIEPNLKKSKKLRDY